MKILIKHEIRGRIRFHVCQKYMTVRQADILLYYLSSLEQVKEAKVYERTGDAVVCYDGNREGLIREIVKFRYEDKRVLALVPEQTGRELNRVYQERLVTSVATRAAARMFLPQWLSSAWVLARSLHYLWKGVRSLAKGRLEVEVLDAVAITVSLIRKDFSTAGSVMFLLGIGELLEEWTHKKSVDDLARSMSLNIEKVWLKTDGAEILTPVSHVKEGDRILIRMGNMIPLDGIVEEGEAMVNQSSLTGESLPVKKDPGSYVYAGTVIEEGQLVMTVKKAAGNTRFEKIVAMIEESEKLKSSLEGKAENLADALVPYSLGGTLLTWLLTGNTTKALSILMVDFSCALKLAMPIAVLSAMREANTHHITVKGGKFLEAIAEADTIVFDKTGTLTKAKPVVAKIVTFGEYSEEVVLKVAACLEEHFPHSMANAVVNEARRRGLEHDEMHSRVDYIVAHGISSSVEGRKVIIGSYHFVFEDEACRIPEGGQESFDNLPEEYSHLYMAVDGHLAAVICIYDPLREEAAQVIDELRSLGVSRLVMMTGDSERAARAISRTAGMDRYFSEVLPEDKAGFIEREKKMGRKVVMVGDGINDSPALSAADAGIAVSEGAAIAREVADITISADNLWELVTLRRLSGRLMERVHHNYRFVISFNLALIFLGVAGVLPPSASALLHNTSTLGISLKSMTDLL